MQDTTSIYVEPEWCFPKGRRNCFETDLECSEREFQEETKLDIDPNSLVYLTTLKDSKYNRILRLYTIELSGQPEPTLDDEHRDWGYYDAKSLPHPIEDNLRQELELKI